MKTVIEMARKAAAVHGHTFKTVPEPETIEFITAFDELVRADERQQIIAKNAPEIERINAYIKALEVAVEAEREACAGECDEWIKNGSALAEDIAAAIRNRSNS